MLTLMTLKLLCHLCVVVVVLLATVQANDPNAEVDSVKELCESCFGAESDELGIRCCNTCNAVRAAYQQREWNLLTVNGITQCTREGWKIVDGHWLQEEPDNCPDVYCNSGTFKDQVTCLCLRLLLNLFQNINLIYN